MLSAVPRAIRSLVLAALTVRLVDEWWSYLPAGIIENLRMDLGVTYEQAASLIGFAFLSGIIGGPLGALADHANRRLIAFVGSTLQTIGLVLFALGQSYVVLVIGVWLLGAAGDLVIRPVEASLAESISEEDLERALGRQHLLSFVGDMAGPATLGLAAALGASWRTVFWLTAAALAAYSVALLFVRFPPRQRDDKQNEASSISTRDVLRNRTVWKLTLAEVLIFPLDEPIAAMAVAAIALNQSVLAQLVAVGYVIGGLMGSVFVEREGLSVRIQQQGAPLLTLGGVLVALSIGLTELGPLDYRTGGALATVSMMVVGVGMALVWGDLHHRQLTVISGRSATVASIVGTFGSVGAVWPWLSGWLADRYSITASLVVFAVAGAALTALIWSMKRQPAGYPGNESLNTP
jgi:MFS family permease